MKIVIAPIGSDGDIRPMIALGVAQRDKGNDVLFCAPPNFKQTVRNHGLTFEPVGKDVKKIMVENAEGIMGLQWKNDRLLYKFLRDDIKHQFEGIGKAAKDADYIVGSGLQVGGQSIGECYKIPYLHVLHTPQVLESRKHPPPAITNHNLPEWLNPVFWYFYKSGINMMLRSTVNRYRKTLDLEPIGDLHRYITRKILIAAHEELAPVPDDIRVDCQQTSYWYLEEEGDLSRDIVDFIDAGSKPVYIGFGSIPDNNPEKTSRIIAELINALDVRLIVSRGWADLGRGIESNNVKIIDFAPHDKLFPKMAAVIHHGGAGTTNTAARAGVPQIIVPHVLDQYYYGHRIRKLKLGPKPVTRLRLCSGNLISALRETLNNNEYTENALILGEKLKSKPSVEEYQLP